LFTLDYQLIGGINTLTITRAEDNLKPLKIDISVGTVLDSLSGEVIPDPDGIFPDDGSSTDGTFPTFLVDSEGTQIYVQATPLNEAGNRVEVDKIEWFFDGGGPITPPGFDDPGEFSILDTAPAFGSHTISALVYETVDGNPIISSRSLQVVVGDMEWMMLNEEGME
jgi:hypothetical protein